MTNDLKSYEIQDAALKMVDYLALMKLKHELLEARVTVLEEKLKEKHKAIDVQELIKEVVDENYVRDIIDDCYIQCIIDSEYIVEIVRDNIHISID